MNKFALLFFFLLLFFGTKSQDKIISISHDTIHCKILSINNERILYELKNSDGSVTGKFIPLNQVEEYLSYQQSEIAAKNDKPKTSKPQHITQNPFYFGLNIGGSTMPWYFDTYESSTTIPDYYKELKTGFHINASAHYLIKSFWGAGIEYSFFKSSTSGSFQSEYGPSIFFIESEKCSQYINYLGASVLFKQHLDAQQKFILNESLSAGVLFLRIEDQVTSPNLSQAGYNDISNNMLITGNSFSAKLGLTAEYRLFKSLSVGLGGDFIWCSLKEASYEVRGTNNYSSSSDKEELANPMNLSRIDYSFVLHFNF